MPQLKQNKKKQLDAIHIEAARIITGATKLGSISLLLSDLGCTPASNLGYLGPTGQFFMGAKLFIGTPYMQNEGVLKKWYRLCENAWFPWQPIVDLRMGICLQKYSYLSCY